MKFHSAVKSFFSHFGAVFLLVAFAASVAGGQWIKQSVDTKASLRGLSVVNENVVWASGTGGTFLKTVDGGKTWTVGKVPDADKLDFRDVEAFSENTAYLLSIGEGENSRIYKTVDGGRSWRLQFKNPNPKAFYDAFAFWNENTGIALGDPIDGKYQFLKTEDGETWKTLPSNMPQIRDGEAAFAASGTCIVTTGTKDAWFVSGGAAARVFHSPSGGGGWIAGPTDMRSGSASQGIFSIAFDSAAKTSVIVGGDYQKPNEREGTLGLRYEKGKAWKDAGGLTGYRSGVTFVDDKTIIAVGSSGSDISTDTGKTWTNLDKENYNAVQAKGRKAIWAVGANDLVARYSMNR